jgi:hypothetical protein
MHRALRLIGGLVLVTVVTGLAACSNDDGDDGRIESPGDMRDETGAGYAGADSDGAEAPPAEARGEVVNQVAALGQRKVIFETHLEIAAANVEERYREVSAIARALGGYAADSRLTSATTDREEASARVTIRIPTERREDALDRLREMQDVDVLSEHTTSSEVTDEYTDLSSRLRNLERSETRYLELMDRAETVSDILSVGERLDNVRAQIEQIQGRLNVLDDLMDFATISVVLVALEDAGEEPGEDSAFVQAWKDAWNYVGGVGEQLVAGAAWASVALILLAPLAIVAGGVRAVTHRREKPAT